MKKGIYTYYKERLIEIGGRNKCLCLRGVSRKNSYDVGRLLMGRDRKVSEFCRFVWSAERAPFPLIGPREKEEIREALGNRGGTTAEDEVAAIKEIMREAEEIERETGRCELYVGYPFVLGSIRQGSQKIAIKAPLLLIPVRIELPDEHTALLCRVESEKIQINRALVFACAQAKKLNVDSLNLDFDDLAEFGGIEGVLAYLDAARIRLTASETRNILAYHFNEPDPNDELTVHSAAVLGRFPVANSIYNDYTALERQKLTNAAILELLRPSAHKRRKTRPRARASAIYPVKPLDYAQEQVLRKADEEGNMVIYGPPGTGKSQTIVNLIADAMTKGKRILVVSQKKAALDVVYSRLGPLAKKSMYITDESKQKKSFYERCLFAHRDALGQESGRSAEAEAAFNALQNKLDGQIAALEEIDRLMNEKRPFGPSLADMYAATSPLSKSGWEYDVYDLLREDRELLALTLPELTEALTDIKAKDLATTYYSFLQEKEKNPMIDRLRADADVNTIAQASETLAALMRRRKTAFRLTGHPYYRQVLTYYYELKKEQNLSAAVDLEYRLSGKRSLLPGKTKKQIREQFLETIGAVDEYAAQYDFLRAVLDDDGYLTVIDNILRGNFSYLRYVADALGKFISLRDRETLFARLDPHMAAVLDFAFAASKNLQSFLSIIDALPQIRIYAELLEFEEKYKEKFAKTVDYPHICARIGHLREQLLGAATKLCDAKTAEAYADAFRRSDQSKDFFYQISKTQKFWPIRKCAEVYGELLLRLFPCWLLSPENVSNLLPLRKDLFDLVIFDEASQVFIENTIPTLYRGRRIVVAGDEKQLRPSALFMRRYLGSDGGETQEDYSVQAALEVDSLLDLAVARYGSADLTYHYRSRSSELIAFSDSAFYDRKLRVVPNLTHNAADRPIVRYKVAGRWINRKNQAEADKIVDLLADIFANRKNRESVGIITFNADQQACVADAIDRAAAKDAAFRAALFQERTRVENGEDNGLFVKNLENVQGDERDIIIFSIGYAENEQKRIYTNFGSLSTEGGENRLNVAITRARTKVIVVTSIEPEDLHVEEAKNNGPKLLRSYLQYVRAVSERKDAEAAALLAALRPEETAPQSAGYAGCAPIAVRLKERLEKAGYTVELGAGATGRRLSLAIYDRDLDRYLVGVELDTDAYASSPSAVERDVTEPLFYEARGWTVMQVFSRDFWLSPASVTRSIAAVADKKRQEWLAQADRPASRAL